MTRRRYSKTSRVVTPGIAYDLLAQELLRTADFQQLLDRLGRQVRQELVQQLVRQPLRALGTSLGEGLQQQISGERQGFALSENQLGGLLRELLDQADSLL